MKFRILRLGIVAVVTLIGFALLGMMVSQAAPARASGPEVTIKHHVPDTEIQTRRLISIPYFGINDSLALSEDGRTISVTGPGECRDGGETFKIRVFVTQDGRSTQAKGRTAGGCDTVADEGWQAVAEAQGRKTTFEAGEAHVRAMIVIQGAPGGALVAQWEKDVTLVPPVE